MDFHSIDLVGCTLFFPLVYYAGLFVVSSFSPPCWGRPKRQSASSSQEEQK